MGLHGAVRKDRRNRLTKVARSIECERPMFLLVNDAIALSRECASLDVDGIGGIGSVVDGKASVFHVILSGEHGEDAGHRERTRSVDSDDLRVRIR